jgi:hypothetical protein
MFAALAKATSAGPRPQYERRKFGRVSVTDVPSSIGTVQNLSAGGMCVLATSRFGFGQSTDLLHENAVLNLTLLTPIGPVEVAARVAWVRTEGGWVHKSIRAGLEFRNLSGDSATAILSAFRNGVNSATLGSPVR